MPSSPKKRPVARAIRKAIARDPIERPKPSTTQTRNNAAVAKEAPRIDFKTNTSRFKNPYNKTKPLNALNKPARKSARPTTASKSRNALNKRR